MNLKTLVLQTCLFFFTTLMMAQDASFNWGFNVYPNYSGRRLIALGFSTEEIQEFEERETGTFGYAAGVMAQWRAEKLGFRIGLNYMASGYQTVRLFIQQDDPDFPTHSQEKYQSNYIEVPVEFIFSHNLVDTKAAMFFMMGASFSYNLSNRTKSISYFGDTQNSEFNTTEGDFQAINYAFQSGIGMQLSIGERITLIFQPNFQFWLKGLLRDSDVNRNLYTVGFKTGILF